MPLDRRKRNFELSAALSTAKTNIRTQARVRRKAIPADERERKSAAIAARVLELPAVREARVVGAYVSVHSEVQTAPLLRGLLARGQRVAVPVVEPPETMELAALKGLDELAPGAHGIPEPPPPHVLVPPDEVDVVLVPGLAFTVDGHRLGNGGGYFDRMLARMPRARRVALAFEEQVVAQLPLEEHDLLMDAVVTETSVVHVERRGARGA